jgi:hypothetical protein
MPKQSNRGDFVKVVIKLLIIFAIRGVRRFIGNSDLSSKLRASMPA